MNSQRGQAVLISLHVTAECEIGVPCWALAQLGERLICIQEVIGSIPIGSTSYLHNLTIERICGCAGSSSWTVEHFVKCSTIKLEIFCDPAGLKANQPGDARG